MVTCSVQRLKEKNGNSKRRRKKTEQKRTWGRGGEVEIVKKKATYIVHGLPSPVKTVAKVLYSGHFTMPDRI